MKAKIKNQAQPLNVSPLNSWEKYMPVILCALAFVLYANTLSNGYNMDDELVTRKHKLTSKGISAIPDIFMSPYYSDNMGYSYEYRPIVHTSFAIEHQFFGDNPTVSHLVNLLLYIVTILVLYKLLKELLTSYSYWVSAIAVALFIAHPLHAEVVASIKNRDEILALLFGLLSWRFAIKYCISQNKIYFVFILFFFSIGLLSKLSILPLSLIIPLSLVYFSHIKGWALAVISFMLLGISFILSPLSNSFYYGILFLGVATIPTILWSLKNDGYKKILSWFEEVKINSKNGTQEDEHDFLSPFNLSFLNWKELLNIYFLIYISIISLLLLLSFYFDSVILYIFSYLLFAIAYYISSIIQKNVILSLISLSFCAVSIFYGYPNGILLSAVLILPVFFINDKFRNVILIIPVLLIVYCFIYFGEYLNLLAIVVALLLITYSNKHRIARISLFIYLSLIGVVLLLGLYRIVVGADSVYKEFLPLVYLLLIILISFTIVRKWLFRVILFVAIPCFLLLNAEGLAMVNYGNDKGAPQSTLNALPPNSTPEDVKSINSVRPIAFAESVINKESPLEEKIGTSSIVLGFYAQKLLMPYPLGFYYGYAYFTPTSIFSFAAIVYALLYLGLFVTCVISFNSNRLLSFALLFYLLSIIIFSGLAYPVVGMAGDRFAFTASVGFCLAVSCIIYRLSMGKASFFQKLIPNKKLYIIVTVILLIYGALTVFRNSLWDSPLSLMSNDMEYLNNSAQAHNLYALHLMRESFEGPKIQPEQQYEMRKLAVIHFDRALQIWPLFFNAAYDKGRAAMIIGDYQAAIDGFEKSIKIGTQKGFIDPYIQLGQIYLQQNQSQKYLRNAKKLLEKENEAEAYNMVARGFFMTGKSDSAKIYLHRAMAQYPNDVSLRKNMSQIFRSEGQVDSLSYYFQ